jgi:hypothetical protein
MVEKARWKFYGGSLLHGRVKQAADLEVSGACGLEVWAPANFDQERKHSIGALVVMRPCSDDGQRSEFEATNHCIHQSRLC